MLEEALFVSLRACELFVIGKMGRSRGEAKQIAGGVRNPNMPTSRLRSSPICQQIELSLSFIGNATFTSTIDIR